MPTYIDASAAVKLVIDEDETEPLRHWLDLAPRQLVTAHLTLTELVRAVRRIDSTALDRVPPVLSTFHLISITAAGFERAGDLDPPELRSLDALHLSVALGLGDDVDSMLTYDQRLTDAAEAHGLTVIAPR